MVLLGACSTAHPRDEPIPFMDGGPDASAAKGDTGSDTSMPVPDSGPCASGRCPDPVVRMAIEGGSVCVERESGRIWCWGNNRLGQLGDGTSEVWRMLPAPVPAIPAGSTLIGGGESFYARLSDGRTLAWGANAAPRSARAPSRCFAMERRSTGTYRWCPETWMESSPFTRTATPLGVRAVCEERR